MTEWTLAGTLQQLRYRWWSFFHRRCLVGFPWFWPARPAGHPQQDAMPPAVGIAGQRFREGRKPAAGAIAKQSQGRGFEPLTARRAKHKAPP